MSGGNIRRYSSDELDAMIARGEDRTDWARLDAMTEEEIERNADEDPDNGPITPEDWLNAKLVIPAAHRDQWLRLDPDLAAWFRTQGPDAEARMRAILRAAVAAARAAEPTKAG
ncbi:MAG: hypothetical protein ACREF1_02715 [Acetobacteraceae bacterium]